MPSLVDYHIARLQDKNKDVRLKHIAELKLIGDPAALEALENVFRTDTDVDVRKAAQEAGIELFKIKQKQQAENK